MKPATAPAWIQRSLISIVRGKDPIEKTHTYKDLLHGEETNGSGIFLLSAMQFLSVYGRREKKKCEAQRLPRSHDLLRFSLW